MSQLFSGKDTFESAVFLQMGGLDDYYVFAFGEVGE